MYQCARPDAASSAELLSTMGSNMSMSTWVLLKIGFLVSIIWSGFHDNDIVKRPSENWETWLKVRFVERVGPFRAQTLLAVTALLAIKMDHSNLWHCGMKSFPWFSYNLTGSSLKERVPCSPFSPPLTQWIGPQPSRPNYPFPPSLLRTLLLRFLLRSIPAPVSTTEWPQQTGEQDLV